MRLGVLHGALGLAALALLADGCGGGGQPRVARVASSTTAATLVACVRNHGYPTVPDPNGEGVITVVQKARDTLLTRSRHF